GASEVTEQRARVLPCLGPLVVVEQLVVHLPELALLSGALGGHRRIAGVLVRRQRKVTKAPPQLSRGDQLIAGHRQPHRRQRPPRPGSSYSSSSAPAAASRARRSASSTMRRPSAISGVSYVTRTS